MADIFDIFKRIEKTKSENEVKPITHIIVGLGNPGREYENTRHNVGFCAIDHVAQRCGVKIDRAKFDALVCECVIGGKRVLLMKPQTLMNASGKAVAPAASFYKIPTENIIVISDDINLDVGRMRVRKSGSDGGQKGLRSIINMLSSDDFPRIRVGVGKKPHPDYDLAAWVLGNFPSDDKSVISELFPFVYSGIEKMLNGDIDGAIALCNSANTNKK